MADTKEVVWHSEFGEGLYPFCPYCDEFAYEREKCVFCGKPYKWVESPIKDTIVEDGNLTVVQTPGKDIFVYTEKGMVAHMSCTKKMTEEELKEIMRRYKNEN